MPLRVWSMMSFHRSDISVAKELMPVLESTTGFVIVIVHVLTQYSNHWTRLMVKLLAQVKTIFHSISLQGCTQPNATARHFFPCYFVFRINVIVCFCFLFLVSFACAAAKTQLIKSKLPNSVLSKIWKLADYNADGKS